MNGLIELVRFSLGFLLIFMMLFMIAGILLFVFWIWMIIDCAKRDFKKENKKIIWILVIVLLSVLGATVYYFAVKFQDKNKAKKKK